MFTLKLYRRGEGTGQLVTRIIPVHHVQVMEIGQEKKTLEIWAFNSVAEHDYETFYVGKQEPDMTALNRVNHWGWGLLENWEGNTTQHFRPYSYG